MLVSMEVCSPSLFCPQSSPGRNQYGSISEVIPEPPKSTGTIANGGMRKRVTMDTDRDRNNWSPMRNPVTNNGGRSAGEESSRQPLDSRRTSEAESAPRPEGTINASSRSSSSCREASPVAIAPKQQLYMRMAGSPNQMISISNTVSAATSLESIPAAFSASDDPFSPALSPQPAPVGDFESLVLSEQSHELERMESECQQMLESWATRRRDMTLRHRQERVQVRMRQQQQQLQQQSRPAGQ